MENPQGTPMPESSVVAFEYKATGFSIPFVVASHPQTDGGWRACFVWHRQHDQCVRANLLFCFRA